MSPELLVVRGGILDDLAAVFKRMTYDFQEQGPEETRFGYSLSVVAGKKSPTESRKEFLTRLSMEGNLRNKQMRVVDMKTLEESGFRLISNPPPPSHFEVDCGTSDPFARLQEFEALLGTPEENPCPFEG